MTAPPEPEPTPAEDLLARHVRDGGLGAVDYEQLCRENPEHVDELRRIIEHWRHVHGVLAALGPDLPLARRLERRYGSAAGADLSLDAPPRTGSDAASSSTLRRLATNAPQNSRYQLLGEVARGGMGAILKVWDADLRRTLAMKVTLGPQTEEGSSAPEANAKILGRFLEEAQVTAQLDHPGILPVHELSLDAEGRVYFTMPLVKGRDLADIFKLVKTGEEGWTQARAVGVLLKVCEAMAYAHSKRVIHRDLKPANVMVGRFGEVYVMDWGLARVLGRQDDKDIRVKPLAELSLSLVQTDRKDSGSTRSDSPLITMDGDIVGTPSYMSPEQARGELSAVGPGSDVFSLGSILYHVLAGHMPYVPEGAKLNAYAVWGLVQSGSPAPLSEVAPGAAPELVAICEKAMAREASERYQDMRDVAEDLHAYLEGRVVGAYRTGPVIEFKKWVGRNKALAATLALAAGAAVTGGVLHLRARERARQSLESRNVELAQMTRRAEEARDEAQRSSELLAAERDVAQAARAETERALAEARRQDYVASITAATINVESGNPAEARRRLDACPEAARGWEWYHLDLALDASTHTLEGHTEHVQALAFDPAGERIASGSEDDTVRIWDAATGDALQVLKGHDSAVRAVAFSPDGRLVATGARDGSLWIWDVAQARKIAELDGHRRHVTGLCFHPGGEQIASGGTDGQVRMWDIATGKMSFAHGFSQRRGLGTVLFDVRALAFSDDGRRLFAGAGNGMVRLMDAQTGELLFDVDGRESSVESVVAVPGGRFVTALGDGVVVPLDADGVWGEPSLTLETPRLRALRLGSRGRRLLAGYEDKSVRLWDVEGRSELAVLRGHGAAARALALAPDGSRMVSSSGVAGDLKVWDARTRSASFSIAVLDKGVRAIECSSDGRFFAVLEIASSRMRVFDAFGTPLHDVSSGGKALSAMAIAPDGRSIVTGASDGALSVWDTSTGSFRVLPVEHDGQVTGIAWHPDGARFATGSYDGTLHVHEVAGSTARAALPTLELGGVQVRDVDVDPRGRWVAAALADGRVLLWDFATNDVRELSGHDSIVTSVAFHPAGELLASGSDDTTLRVWDIASGDCLGTLRGHEGRVRGLAIDPSGRRCVTASGDETLRVWDLATLRTLATLEGHAAEVLAVAFSPDGERMFSGATDRVVRVWESRLETATGVWNAAAQRRALEARLSELFMNHLDATRVEELVARDPALAADERETALQLVRAQTHVPADWMAEAAWSVVCDPGRSVAEYERARAAARIAAESRMHLTHRGYYRATLAFALYRLGRHDEALQMTDEALPRLRRSYRNDRFPGAEAMRAIDEIIAALSLAALGERERALERYEAIPALEDEDETLEQVLAEAERILRD